MGYIPFTDEEKALANSVDLADFLRMRWEKSKQAQRIARLSKINC